MLHPGDKPGLGVELDVDEAGKYPYETGLPAVQPTRRRHRSRLVSEPPIPRDRFAEHADEIRARIRARGGADDL